MVRPPLGIASGGQQGDVFLCHGDREGTVVLTIELVIGGYFLVRQYNGYPFVCIGELLGQVKACAGAQAQQTECREQV